MQQQQQQQQQKKKSKNQKIIRRHKDAASQFYHNLYNTYTTFLKITRILKCFLRTIIDFTFL